MKFRIWMLFVMGASLLSITNTVLASENGFYVGADAGAANLMDKESHSIHPESHQLGYVGAVGGGFAGYDYGVNDKTRFAVEAFADATNLQTSIKHASNTYKMNQYYNLGIRVLPEYVFTTNTMGHLIIGFANGRFQIKDNGVYGLVSTSYNKNGLQTGMGLTTALKCNFFLRFDVLYTAYSSNTDQGTGQSYTNRFSQLAGEVSLYYKFT